MWTATQRLVKLQGSKEKRARRGSRKPARHFWTDDSSLGRARYLPSIRTHIWFPPCPNHPPGRVSQGCLRFSVLCSRASEETDPEAALTVVEANAGASRAHVG